MMFNIQGDGPGYEYMAGLPAYMNTIADVCKKITHPQ